MSKTKRIIILFFILFLVGSIVIIPMFDNYSKPVSEADEIIAQFDFQENVELKHGDVRKIYINNSRNKASKIQLFIDDTLLQTWISPSDKVYYNLDSKIFNVGAKELRICVYQGSTLVNEDSRLLRVLSDLIPKKASASVINLFPHNEDHFTQGLEFSGNTLFEGTGQNGASLLATVDLNSGKLFKKVDLESTYFGEGITILGNNVYQITWQQQKCFVYNKGSLEKIKEINYSGEGWGLCNDHSNIIMSDGSERLYFRSPQTFEINKIVEVYDNNGPITNLNELEYVNGKIYANIWQQNYIVVIDPSTGKVIQKIDCDEVVLKARGMGEVLNGIAFHPLTKKLYLTGKNWSKVAEVNIK